MWKKIFVGLLIALVGVAVAEDEVVNEDTPVDEAPIIEEPIGDPARLAITNVGGYALIENIGGTPVEIGGAEILDSQGNVVGTVPRVALLQYNPPGFDQSAAWMWSVLVPIDSADPVLSLRLFEPQ